jgi:uncharacterized protein (DUF58 family)
MPVRERQTFPLVPHRRRLVGLPFGELPSRHRGPGGDVIGTRPYETGDPVSTIDWFATARLSAVSGRDEFVVRDRSADEAPRVALLCDRRPAMAIFPASLPWLQKPRALAEATAAIIESAAAARSDVASLDLAGAGGQPYWLPPGRGASAWRVLERQAGPAAFDAPEDNLEQALAFLAGLRSDLPAGSFVFVLSDFLVSPPAAVWMGALARGWDIVPIVIQDPVWEQSFPPVGGVALPIADPVSGRIRLVRFSARQAALRRERNEQQLRRLLAEFASFGLEAVLLGTSEPDEIDRAFIAWAESRRRSRWAR